MVFFVVFVLFCFVFYFSFIFIFSQMLIGDSSLSYDFASVIDITTTCIVTLRNDVHKKKRRFYL